MPGPAAEFGGPASPAYPDCMTCKRCGQQLPLREANAGEAAAVWICVRCGSAYPAVCLTERLPGLGNRVAFDERYFDVSYLPRISSDMRAEILRMAAAAADDEGRWESLRKSRRVAVALLAAGVELDDEFYPTSPTFQLMVTNISATGVGLVSMGRLSAPFLALKLRSSPRAEPIQVVVEMVRQRELRNPYIEIGGSFVLRLGSVPK